jgi:hypothetical protein
MKTKEIFDKTIEELDLEEFEIYQGNGHLTSLGIAVLTCSMIGSGELKK